MKHTYLKQNEKFKFEGKWMELETISLSEVAQIQKDKHFMVFLTYKC